MGFGNPAAHHSVPKTMDEFGRIIYNRCKETGKRMMSKKDAVTTINFARHGKQKAGVAPTACYHCDHCNSWHLTREGTGVKSR